MGDGKQDNSRSKPSCRWKDKRTSERWHDKKQTPGLIFALLTLNLAWRWELAKHVHVLSRNIVITGWEPHLRRIHASQCKMQSSNCRDLFLSLTPNFQQPQSQATNQTFRNVITWNKKKEERRDDTKTLERWECCSLGCRLGGGAWKRPCRGLPLVESVQYPSYHPAPSPSSLPSANRAGEQEMVWLAAMNMRGHVEKSAHGNREENQWSQRDKWSGTTWKMQ